MGKSPFTYDATEKLKSRKVLQALFATGKSFQVFPLKIFYMPVTEQAVTGIRAGVGVSARNFRKAVDRNRIKRLLREVYRLHKGDLQISLQEKNRQVAVFFLYLGKELPEYALLEEKMKNALHKLAKQLA